MSAVPNVMLNNGVAMPQLGFGVFQVPNDETAAAVSTALDAGYRSIDTAAIYGNESGVGQAVAASGISREELFITNKVWNKDQGYWETLRAFDTSLEKLGLDYLDLYLIHWPTPARDRYDATWRALEKLLEDKRVRAIGVSNFNVEHLDKMVAPTSVVPAVNQIELHPLFAQQALRAEHQRRGIVTEAWSPLAQGGELLQHTVIVKLAEKYQRTPAQIILRWHIQLGNVVIPKSVTPQRIAENIAIFDFELAEADMTALSTLDAGIRIGPDPATFNAS